MSPKRTRILSLVTLLLVFTMAVGSATATEQARLHLLGQWEWVSAEGGLAGGAYGPADWGYTWQLSFLDDGTVIDFRDGVERARSVFTIEESFGNNILTVEVSDPMVSPFAECDRYRLSFPDGVRCDEMLLQPRHCADLYDLSFVRRGPVDTASNTWSQLKSLFR